MSNTSNMSNNGNNGNTSNNDMNVIAAQKCFQPSFRPRICGESGIFRPLPAGRQSPFRESPPPVVFPEIPAVQLPEENAVSCLDPGRDDAGNPDDV